MRKALILILTAFLIVSLFIACKNEPEPEPIPIITIRFDGNGSTGGEMKNLTVLKGEAADLPGNKYVGKEGDEFTGWNTKADGSGDSYTDDDVVCFENDTTLYAQWHKGVRQITFDANGGSGLMTPQWILYDEASVLKPNRFTLKGYVFTGWNTEKDGSGDAYCDSDTVCLKEDTTLYAQWHKGVGQIAFNANGGSGAMFPQWVIYDESAVLNPNRFKSDGYVFTGWNTKSDGTGKEYPDGDTVRFTEDTTLYAQWHKGVRQITFDTNGGSGWMLPQWVIYDESSVLTPNRYEMSGYHFVGWNTEKDGSGVSYPDGDTVRFTEDATLYAQWGFNGVVEIKYDANGGEGMMLPQWVIKDIETGLRQNRFSREEHFFTGWNTKSDGTGDAYSDADRAVFEKDTTLYAQWHKEVEKITFDANGGGGLMFPQWVEKDEATALKPNTFSWKGHYFIGWNTEKDGKGTQYADRAEIKTDSDITLYAQWVMDISTMADKTHWNENDGKYFTLSADVTIDERVEISGDITLILPEGMTLTAKRGITLSDGNALTIEGSGTLVADATEEEDSAGIGGEFEQDGGTITINGGTINAIAGEGGAGIGGGAGKDYGRNGGIITINGGTVKATGNEKGAGIGGGNGDHEGGNGGTITINGGTIEATGGRLAAGIGAGHGFFGGNCGTVTINGGTVNASGGDGGAGIGGGITEGECGTVTINGGTVNAKGIGGAGIGGGYSQSGVFVTINGGTVKAASDSNDVPAIGPGPFNNLQGRLTIGYSEIQANSLVINSGWSLYYGNSENPSDHVDGPHDGNDIESYRGRYMNITAPST